MKNLSALFKNVLAIFLVITITSCHRQGKVAVKPEFNPEFAKYISAYTSGLVPRNTSVILRFSYDFIPNANVGKSPEKPFFSFEPEIKGKTTWIDTRTIEFKPDQMLASGQIYEAKFQLSYLMDTIRESLKSFPFQFYTRKQEFQVLVTGIAPKNFSKMMYQQATGTITTDEPEDLKNIEKIISATINGNSIKIKLSSYDLTHFNFIIDSIKREANQQELVISWDGKELGSSNKGSQKLNVPSLGDFIVSNVNATSEPDPFISIQFSDPIDPVQDLNGLIHCKDHEFKYHVDNGTVTVYPAEPYIGRFDLIVEAGIKNAAGYKLKEGGTYQLAFKPLKPQLKMLGTGTIIPNANGILFPFEAVNLKAVDVRITKIYEKNVLQFLQFNNLNGDEYMEYVGKEVFLKKVSIENGPKLNLSKWNRHALDLTKLITPEMGAIYRIQIRFRREYAIVECDKDSTTKEKKEKENNYLLNKDKKKPSLWDYYDRYSYYDYDGEEEGDEDGTSGDYNDPCGTRYYKHQRGIARNVLASDLGMLAKRGSDGSIFMAVTNLNTAEPIANVPIQLYDLQRQVIKTLTTDGEGLVHANLNEQPFVAVATYGKQRGYLKLNNEQLSLDRFDISGKEYHRGVKGYIYGERGVWRPGDSIYLTFILEDKLNALPKDHPIIFEMYNPSGQQVQKAIRNTSVDGFYDFRTATDLNAPTGNYSVKVNVGGVIFDKKIKVETVTPNRLKLNLKMDKNYVAVTDKTIGNLHVAWLHGAPAGGLNASVSATFRKTKNVFENYKDYVFTDPLKDYPDETVNIFNGQVDASGNAEIPNKIEINQSAPGPLTAEFVVKATEPGGNFSTDVFSTTYFPYDHYVGIHTPEGEGAPGVLLTDKEHVIDILTIDKEGKPFNGPVTVYLYKMEWRWWWSNDENDRGSYNGRTYNDPILTEIITTTNGKGRWKIIIPEANYGRYLVRAVDAGGHVSGKIVYIDYPGWYSRTDDNMSGTNILNFSANKKKYNVGETATLDIPMGFDGHALVTIENGSKVMKAEWVKTKKSHSKYSFKITADMRPNVYAYVTLMQPQVQAVNDLPVRLYGVIPITVDDPKSHLQPVLTMPKVLEPEQTVKLNVSEASGKPMTYTIAMVDEGLLDLTRFKTPDPWQNFNAKKALQVRSWDLFDNVLGNYNQMIKRLISIGGDGDGGYLGEGVKAQRFKPMVKFLGPFKLVANGKATHTVHMPEYIGSIRTMIIAGNNYPAYGSVEITTPVRKPLMVLGTLPRVLGPNEEVNLPVSVFAMENNVKDVTVEIITNDMLSVNGPSSQRIQFTETGEKTITFPVKVKSQLGIASVEIKAVSGKLTAHYTIELQVRTPNALATRNTFKQLPGFSTQVLNYEAFGMKGTNKGTMEVSNIPPLNIESRLSYLIHYPYGCVEQTTSSVLPQLYVYDLLNLSTGQKKEIEQNVKAGIKRLQTFQLSNGGLSYWPHSYGEEASDWGTNYAGHFLIEAKNHGYTIPYGMLDKWKSYQRNAARNYNGSYNQDGYHYDNSDLIQAYRLYLLSLVGSPELGAMNRLRENGNLILQARWMLAAAYYQAGQKGIAVEITKKLSTTVGPYRELDYSYGSDFRDEAMMLETLTLLGDYDQAYNILNKLSEIMRGDAWLSTQETSYALMAMAKYAEKKGPGNMDIQYRMNDGDWKTISGKASISQLALDLKKNKKGKIEIKNNSKAPVFTNLVMTGIPEAGNEIAEQKSINLAISYTDTKGNIIDPAKLPQGTDFIAEIKVTNDDYGQQLNNMALSFIIPSGWQVYNPRMTGNQFSVKTSKPQYMDIRDDRVYLFYSMEGAHHRYSYYNNRNRQDNPSDEESDDSANAENDNKSASPDYSNSQVFRVALNASFAGKFYMPGIYTEAMYNKSIHAQTSGKWITVTKSNNNGL
jgi:alpha-2-macroglobulin